MFKDCHKLNQAVRTGVKTHFTPGVRCSHVENGLQGQSSDDIGQLPSSRLTP